MKVKVYEKCLKLNYFSTVWSKASNINVIILILSIIIPFLIAYYSKGFWLKRDTFYEQPDIKYKYEYIFIAETNKLNFPVFCTNIFQTDDKTEEMDLCNEIKVKESDYNADSKYDELELTIILNNLQETKIYGITLILPLIYKLHTECPLQMESAVMIQHLHHQPGIKLSVVADVMFSQKESIPCSRNIIFNAYNKSVIKNHTKDLKDLFTEDYFTRNVSTTIQNLFTTWVSGTGSVFELNIKLRYPEHKIYYTPQLWQVMKFAWVQYLSLYILFSWILNKLKDYIFVNRFVSYYIDPTSYNKIK